MTFIVSKKRVNPGIFNKTATVPTHAAIVLKKSDKLTAFPTDLLPHEIAGLQQVQQSPAADNLGILEILCLAQATLRQTRASHSLQTLI